MSDDNCFIVDDMSLWDRICVNKRPSKKLFEKIVINQIEKLEKENKQLKEDLKTRSKQIGVACLKHDLVHSLFCGRCAENLQQENKQLREALDIITRSVTPSVRYEIRKQFNLDEVKE